MKRKPLTREQKDRVNSRRRERYHTEPSFRETTIRLSADYQKRMYAESEEYRAKKAWQHKNPKKSGRGRPAQVD